MTNTLNAPGRTVLHPLQAILVAGAMPLFLGALFADMAYSGSFEIQWKNFASWLIVGGLVFTGFAALGALVGLLRKGRGLLPLLLVLLAVFVFGFANALVHAKDAWASMPAALILAWITAVLALAAVVVGFFPLRFGART